MYIIPWNKVSEQVDIFYYQGSEGILDFLPGERSKYITLTIIDNPVPELDKDFRVELYNTDGGGEKTTLIPHPP